MKIVITDGFTFNPGDLTWGTIAACGDLVVYERISLALPQHLVCRLFITV